MSMLLTMQIDGDLIRTIKFVDSLKIPYIAPSFGGCESIVDQPAIMSYWYFLDFLVILIRTIDHLPHSSWARVLLVCDITATKSIFSL